MEETLAAGTRLGPYDIVSLLGAGGMGQVYRARDPRLGRDVAIKILTGTGAADPDGVGRFEAEARAAGTLDHPNLLVVYDIGREGAVLYIVSELLEGETLRERLRNGAVPQRQAIDYAVQIARTASRRALPWHHPSRSEATTCSLLANRRVTDLDFGVAKLMHASGPMPDAVAGVRKASWWSWAPLAIWRRSRCVATHIDQRADIFALAW